MEDGGGEFFGGGGRVCACVHVAYGLHLQHCCREDFGVVVADAGDGGAAAGVDDGEAGGEGEVDAGGVGYGGGFVGEGAVEEEGGLG